MKYANPLNFVLAIAALAFSVYVFSVTFMSNAPPTELAADESAGAPDQALSGMDAMPQGREPASDPDPAAVPGAAQPNFTGQQAPPRDRRSVSPPNTRSPFRPAANRTRPPSRPNQVTPGSPENQPRSGMPSGAVIPEDAPPPRPPARQPSSPPSIGSAQDRRPLPLRDRGGVKREPDPNAPPPTRGSRQ